MDYDQAKVQAYTNTRLSASIRDDVSDQLVGQPGELNRLSSRLETILNAMRDVTMDLSCHADRLHGNSTGAAGGTDRPHPVRSGALGAFEDLIDSVGEQLEVLQSAARRNTSLA